MRVVVLSVIALALTAHAAHAGRVVALRANTLPEKMGFVAPRALDMRGHHHNERAAQNVSYKKASKSSPVKITLL